MKADGKKPALALVIGGAKEEAADDDAEDSGEYSAVVGELFEAMKADDEEAFAKAFKAAVMSCK
jgi:hypothetical protein